MRQGIENHPGLLVQLRSLSGASSPSSQKAKSFALLVAALSVLLPAHSSRAETAVRTFVYHQITHFDANQGFNTGGTQAPIISRDGSKIAFARAPGAGVPENPNRILTMNSDGTGEQEVDSYTTFCYCGSMIDISDDGSTVASSDSEQLRVSDSSGARPLVAFDSNDLNGLKLSGDGSKVFFRLGRDTSIRGTNPAILMPRGIWVIDADGTDLRQIVGVTQMAGVLGIQPNEVSFFQGEFDLDASFDGSRIIFNCLVAPQSGGEGQGLFGVNLDGSNLHDFLRRVSFLQIAAISGDGSKVAYNFATFSTNVTEIGVFNFDGTGRVKLTDSTVEHGSSGHSLPIETERMQLTTDGSKLLIGGNGLLYNTDGSEVVQLNLYVPDFSTGISELLRPGLLRGTMNGNATRFEYISPASPYQIQLLEIDPATRGEAPNITQFGTDPEYLLQSGSMATATARIAPAPLVANIGIVRDGLEDSDLESANGYNQLYLNDSATRGDAVAGDGLFTYDGLRSGTDNLGRPPPLGPRTVAVEAATRSTDGKLHGIALFFEPFAIVSGLVTSPDTAIVNVGVPFAYQIVATNAPSSYNASGPNSSALPGGISVNTQTGIVSGTFATSGTYSIVVVANSGESSVQKTVAIQVKDIPPSDESPVIFSPTAATGRVGAEFFYRIDATADLSTYLTLANLAFEVSALPAGLSFDSFTGEITGTPTQAGNFLVDVSRNGSVLATLQITISGDPQFPVIISGTTAAAQPGQPFSFQIQVDGTTATDSIIYSYSGTLPAGLTFDPATGTISGTIESAALHRRDSAAASLASAVNNALILYAKNSHGTAVGQLRVAVSPQALIKLLNISTRLPVETGDNVLIAGFIITGEEAKKILVRAIGPSLSVNGTPVSGRLMDPVLELHNGSGTVIASNDNWRSDHEGEIKATTIPPTSDAEAAIVATLNPGVYTAVLNGANGSSGIALAEVYDLSSTATSKLANISTRGFVNTGDNVLIGGFIIAGNASGSARVIVRAIGPTLSSSGVSNVLSDPTLEIHNSDGSLAAGNDNWRSDQQTEIEETTIPPPDDAESAIVLTLAPGGYTAIVKGANNSTGVGLVEVYHLE